MVVPHPKGVNIVWNCVKDIIFQKREEYKAIVLHGLYYKVFEEEDGDRCYIRNICVSIFEAFN